MIVEDPRCGVNISYIAFLNFQRNFDIFIRNSFKS